MGILGDILHACAISDIKSGWMGCRWMMGGLFSKPSRVECRACTGRVLMCVVGG